jgi:nucleotide-binding universal stress UspA family protein
VTTRVLVATDGSGAAIAAARAATRLFPGAEFVLATVMSGLGPAEELAYGAGGIAGPVLTPEQAEDLAREREAAAMTALTETAGAMGIAGARQDVLAGPAGDALCDFAAEIDADVAVVGSHGHGALARLVLGSVSQHVVRHAPCPVLVVREDVADRRNPA